MTRFSLSLPPDSVFSDLARPTLAISPDGAQLVYAADELLYLRAMDSEEATPILGTEGARVPFFSSDGEWVGFVVIWIVSR